MDDLQSNAIDDQDNTIMRSDLTDYGPAPVVIDIAGITMKNKNFRTTLWTGDHLQLALMSLNPGESIGVEKHEDSDQFIKIVEGYAVVQTGITENNLDSHSQLTDANAVMIPAGTWHNITNTGYRPLKLFTIYGPPAHPYNTIHQTKQDSIEDEMTKKQE